MNELNSVDWMIAVVALFIYSCFFLAVMSRPSVKKCLMGDPQQYATLDLRELNENDIIIIGNEYFSISTNEASKLHARLARAILAAKDKGDNIVCVPLNGCNIKVIKKSPKTDNLNLVKATC